MHLKLKAFGTTKQITCLHYHFMYIFCFVFEKKVAAPQSRIFFIINTFLSSNHTWVLPLPSALCLFPPGSYAVDKRAKLCFLLWLCSSHRFQGAVIKLQFFHRPRQRHAHGLECRAFANFIIKNVQERETNIFSCFAFFFLQAIQTSQNKKLKKGRNVFGMMEGVCSRVHLHFTIWFT